MLFVISENKQLSRIAGCEAHFHVRTHRGLRKVQQLIPENTLLGVGDHIPGLATGKREPNAGKNKSYKSAVPKKSTNLCTKIVFKKTQKFYMFDLNHNHQFGSK